MISIITTCKGRLHHLRQTLPTMLAQESPCPFEVIVVDYACPDGAYDWCLSLMQEQSPPLKVPLPTLTALRVLDAGGHFRRSHAKNCGARAASGGILAFVDADIRLGPAWLAEACGPLLAGRAGLSIVGTFKKGWDVGGTCAVRADLFHQVRGYDESFTGWGLEDADLYARVSRLAAVARFTAGAMFPIRHRHAERLRHHQSGTLASGVRQNRARLRRRGSALSSSEFGRSKYEMSRGTPKIEEAWSFVRRHRRRPCPEKGEHVPFAAARATAAG